MATTTYPPEQRSRSESKEGSTAELAHRHVGSSFPHEQERTELVAHKLSTRAERQYLASLFWIMVVCGWNDASR